MSTPLYLDLLKTLFKDTKDGVLIFDTDLNVSFISEPLKTLLPELKINQNIAEFLDDDWQNTLYIIICGFESNITPIFDDQENICFYVLKTSNKYIPVSYEYPFSLDVSRTSIIDLANRFYTPLTIMASTYTYLNNNLPVESYDEKTKKAFNTIKQNFYILLKILGNMNDFASIDPFYLKTELNLKTINIVDFIKKTVYSVNNFSAKADIPINLNMPEDLCIFVSVDIKRLERILLILISNCFKYTKENNQINITLYETLNFISISISDKGIGMSKETINKNFSPHRLTESLKKPSGSSLVIAKIFVEQMGGSMIIESAENVGTKISFTISKNLTSSLNLSSSKNDELTQDLFAQKYIEFCDIIDYEDFPK